MRSCLGIGPVLVGLALLVGCSSYSSHSPLIKKALYEENYDQALSHVEKISKGDSELLYLYEKGLILHYQNRYVESNEALEQAELLLEDLYTKSVTREVGALLVGDALAKYRGDAFEALLTNYYKILNYLYLDDVEGALVECRRINQKLQLLIDGGETYYVNDPFLQYLTGMVYRMAGEYGEADVSFRVAREAYAELEGTYAVSAPDELVCDMTANAHSLGDYQAVEDYDTAGRCAPLPDGFGTVNLFIECGYVAYKQEVGVVLPIYKDDDTSDRDEFALRLSHRRHAGVVKERKLDYVLRISLPALERAPLPFARARVFVRARAAVAAGAADSSAAATAPGGFDAVTVSDLDALSAKAFKEKEGKVLVRAIIRGLAKYAAKQEASDENVVLGWAVNALGAATETADTRSWTTLPARILMTQITLPQGTYDLEVKLEGAGGGAVGSFVIEGVPVVAGRIHIINHRIY